MSRSLTVLVLAISILVPAEAAAYVRSTTTKSHAPLKWMYTKCAYMRVDSDGSDDINDGSDVAAAKKSIDNWRKVISNCSYFQFVLLEDSPDATPDFTKDGTNENTIHWIEKGWAARHPKMEQAAAITTVYYLERPGGAEDGRILDADIELNGDYFHFTTTGDQKRTDVENTVTHELGHLIGLDHPCDDNTRVPVPKDDAGNTIPKCSIVVSSSNPAYIEMREVTMFNFAEPGETKKRTPEADDIRGVCEIYPPAEAPEKCEPVTLHSDDGCSLGALPAPPRGLPLWLLLLLPLLALRRRSR